MTTTINFIDTNHNDQVRGTRPLIIEPKSLISIKSQPLAWLKKAQKKPCPLTYCVAYFGST